MGKTACLLLLVFLSGGWLGAGLVRSGESNVDLNVALIKMACSRAYKPPQAPPRPPTLPFHPSPIQSVASI